MAHVLKQTEEIPASYPSATGLSTAAAALDGDVLWQRIEAYTARRWTARNVVWIVEAKGGECWEPPLSPVVSLSGACWNENTLEWEAVTVVDHALGYILTFDATYKITASVGGGDLPAAVAEAFRRLAEYSTAHEDRAGVSQSTVTVGPIQTSYSRNPAFMAKALINSGAADLLRPYRRA
ncbi:hypothetical protein ACN2XU_17370 [Primorskyibacter sp. 2E107]|uniref:hypothetical protein n=1 Tax=Primorskyibacter sp. 2E107 TaxID=3403458 RepID=UPI003AF82ACA